MTNITKTFKTIDILNNAFAEMKKEAYSDDPESVGEWIMGSREHSHMDEFEEVCHYIFKVDDVYWRVEFEHNAGAGYNEFVGISDWKQPWEGKLERREFECIQVRSVEKTITTWEPVEKESTP